MTNPGARCHRHAAIAGMRAAWSVTVSHDTGCSGVGWGALPHPTTPTPPTIMPASSPVPCPNTLATASPAAGIFSPSPRRTSAGICCCARSARRARRSLGEILQPAGRSRTRPRAVRREGDGRGFRLTRARCLWDAWVRSQAVGCGGAPHPTLAVSRLWLAGQAITISVQARRCCILLSGRLDGHRMCFSQRAVL